MSLKKKKMHNQMVHFVNNIEVDLFKPEIAVPEPPPRTGAGHLAKSWSRSFKSLPLPDNKAKAPAPMNSMLQ